MKQIAKDNDAQWQSNTPAEKQAKHGPSSHRIVKAVVRRADAMQGGDGVAGGR